MVKIVKLCNKVKVKIIIYSNRVTHLLSHFGFYQFFRSPHHFVKFPQIPQYLVRM
jgi:hypothetical protein